MQRIRQLLTLTYVDESVSRRLLIQNRRNLQKSTPGKESPGETIRSAAALGRSHGDRHTLTTTNLFTCQRAGKTGREATVQDGLPTRQGGSYASCQGCQAVKARFSDFFLGMSQLNGDWPVQPPDLVGDRWLQAPAGGLTRGFTGLDSYPLSLS